MFELTLLPASDGDCLLLSYGDTEDQHHVLIDGGRAGAYKHLKPKLAAIAARQEKIELLVLTHIDADHIEGFLSLAEDKSLPVEVSEIWFNGFDQMATLEPMGPGQGDRFSKALKDRGWVANQRFGNGPICLAHDKQPVTLTLPGGLKITLLSPDTSHLGTLRDRWEKWRTNEAVKAEQLRLRKELDTRLASTGLEALGRKPLPAVLDIDQLADGEESLDTEPPNGSSIAFVAEWNSRRVLLTGDAHPDLLADVLRPMAAEEGGRYRVDLFKVSHHGSLGNTTRDLVQLLACKRFAISTNGAVHGHPDPEAIAKLLKYSSPGERTLYFNYGQPRTMPWSAKARVRGDVPYKCLFPASHPGEITISV